MLISKLSDCEIYLFACDYHRRRALLRSYESNGSYFKLRGFTTKFVILRVLLCFGTGTFMHKQATPHCMMDIISKNADPTMHCWLCCFAFLYAWWPDSQHRKVVSKSRFLEIHGKNRKSIDINADDIQFSKSTALQQLLNRPFNKWLIWRSWMLKAQLV